MRIFLIYLISISSLSATNWYVDVDVVGGNGSGSSWANACSTLTQLPWENIGDNPNDTVYMSDGLYDAQNITNEGWRVYQPVICPSWEAAHSADSVKIHITSGTIALSIGYSSNIKFYGISFFAGVSADTEQAVFVERDSLITFENCRIFSDGNAQPLQMTAVVKPVIQNCIIEQLANDLSADQDPFGSFACVGMIFTGNKVYYRNGCLSTTAHRDILHWNGLGAYDSYSEIETYNYAFPLVIANNLIMFPNEESDHAVSGVYLTDIGTNEVWFYNNILVCAPDDITPINFTNSQITTDYNNSVRCFNNTIVGSNGPVMYWNEYYTGTGLIDSIWIKNNIVIRDSTGAGSLNFVGRTDALFNAMYKEIDYNYYANIISTSDYIYSVTNPADVRYDWGEWTGGIVSFDLNGDTTIVPSSVVFTDKWSETIGDWITTTGRDAGVDISVDADFTLPNLSNWDYDASVTLPPNDKDILGNDRDATWDLGGLEYQTQITVPKIILMNR